MRELILESPPLAEDWAFVWDDIPIDEEVYLTEDEITEISASAYDCRYFIERFCWIERNETGKILQFIPYTYQWDILDIIQGGDNLVINKSRRVGVSWMMAAYVAWLINFHEGINILLLSKKEDVAKKLLRKVKFILNNLTYHDHKDRRRATPATFLRGEIGIDNQQVLSIVYRNDDGDETGSSEVSSLTTTTDSGRSEGATLIFWDECAFAPDEEETWGAILPTTLRGGQYVLASTPNGVGGVFWSMVRDGEAGVNDGYIHKEVHWSEAGISHEQVMRVKSAMKMTNEMFLQEFELKFVQIGGTAVFDKMHLDVCYRPLDENPALHKMLIEYEESGEDYYSGIDSATGTYSKNRAPDFNAFVALTKTCIVAGVSQNRHGLGEWAGKHLELDDGSVKYIDGDTTRLHRQYPGVAYIEKNNSGYVVITNHRTPKGSRSIAKKTDPRSKLRIINAMVLAIEGHMLILTDLSLYQQMHDYMRIAGPGTFGPPNGGYDDLVMALAWAYDALTDHGGKDPPKLPPPSPPSRESVIGISVPDALMSQDREFQDDPTRAADFVSPLIDLPVPDMDFPEPSEEWYQ